MNLQEISLLITKAASAIDANEKLPLPILAAKARREAQARPTDTQLVNASQVLTKMASDKTFIGKEELREIVNRFTASHSKLASVFAEELGSPQAKVSTFQREGEGATLEQDYQRFADPTLSNALSAALSENPTEKLYTDAAAKRAHRAAHAQLLAIGFEPDKMSTFAGRGEFIICQATHETPKGQAHVLVPVEMRDDRAILPTLFLSRAGFQDIEAKPYAEQIVSSAGKAFRVDGAKLLDVLERAKRGSDGPVDAVEMAAIKIASEAGEGVLHDPNSVLYKELEDVKEDVALPHYEATEEAKFAETLGKPDGVARFVHGDRVVEAGRSMLVRKFAEMGYGNVQVRVSDVEEDKIFYAVAVATTAGLKVPVEVNGNMIIPPKVVFANDFVTSFSKEAIDEVIANGDGGNKRALAAASACYDMKPTELLEVVKESVAEGNYLRAEEAINVLGEVDQHAQKVAIAHMMMNIYEPGQKPEGEMQEMQRIANQEVKDTPQFMTSKIFFPEGA